ncbi:Clr6 histone deacetylase associated PHD protein-2 Cph2 [Emydomyces testavorans]|uniref:Clr6 histone deacetylase associated PHD protein-2 Cph2 n=1 Tax=Emydomyces testavorans TaxID=2070801 RepID=A0AAF0DFM5_9EURO|nr:Clr6 histone deacetylase associated PHD protein-2 Cph2 [Emydomyces testavorans]
MTEREITPMTDLSPLIEPSPDDLAADWTQWMCWDEFEADETSNHVNISQVQANNSNNKKRTVSHLNVNQLPVRPAFTFQGNISSPQIPTALTNIDAKDMDFQIPFSPNFALNTQNIPSFAPPVALNVSVEQSPPSHTSPDFPPTPVSAGSGRKRKSSEDDGIPSNGSGASMSPPAVRSLPSKKRSHNVIEKRYRANLNEKIAELRDSVPCLRIMYKQRFGGGTNKDDDDEEETIASTNKLNKASILSKATEYIKHLEMRNKRLDEENIALKNRLRHLEKSQEQGLSGFPTTMSFESTPSSFTASSDSVTSSPPSVFSQGAEFSPEGSPNPLYPPEGLIKVPEYFKRLRPSGPQPHYADSLISLQGQSYDHETPNEPGRHGGFANKFMLGTLAGLMVVGTFESQKEESSDRGLLSVPLQILGQALRYARSHIYVIRTNSWQIRALSNFAMTALFVVGCMFFVYLYLFYSRPSLPKSKLRNHRSAAASATEFRRDAWLTSIQTVGVPRHTFFPEWFAVTSRCFEYCLRCLLGWRLYSVLTGISEEDEKGRVKAWDIALDAQLTGGDAEVSKSRLVLTIFAAGTLPRSLCRMMLKALHCRILLWRVGSPGSFASNISNHIAGMLANYQWQLAQKMQKIVPKDDEGALPSHLAYLLEYDCEEIFTDSIVQRASNMIWNCPTQEATDGEDSLLDVVVEDSAIRCPLDAVAAWWSSRALQEALIHSLDVVCVDCSPRRREAFERYLEMALKSAPPTSAAYTRAAAIKALFFDEDRVTNINSVLAALPRPKREPATSATIFLDSSVPPSIRDEICTAVRCAMIAAILRGQIRNQESASSQLSLHNAIELFNRLPIDTVELTLLGFASLYHLLHMVSMDERLAPSSSLSSSLCSASDCFSVSNLSSQGSANGKAPLPLPDLGRVASRLMYWVKNAYNPISSGFTDSLAEKVVDGCVEVCRNAGVDIDDMEANTERKGHRKRVSGASRSSVCENATEHLVLADGELYEENEVRKTRSESIRSDDTGYGSLSPNEG